MATFYLDFEGGNDANDGTTFANRWKTFTAGATAARIAPGDTIRVMASPLPTDTAQNATWTKGSTTLTLTSAVTANIDLCETAWTAATNASTGSNSNSCQGSGNTSFSTNASFTTGKIAYKALAGSTDFSAYQQISLWIYASVTIPASTLSIRLCSDTAGAVTVNTAAIPAMAANNQWVPVTIDTGGALGNAIQSVAVYADAAWTNKAAIYLDNVLACKAPSAADSLTLKSLVAKAHAMPWQASTAYSLGDIRRPTEANRTGFAYKCTTAGTSGGSEPTWPGDYGLTVTDGLVVWTCFQLEEYWHSILSINGTTVKLNRNLSGAAPQTTTKGYAGASETVRLWKREAIDLDAITTTNQSIQDAGTDGSLIQFIGGWDRTNMSSRTGQTWLIGGAQRGYSGGLMLSLGNNPYVCLDGFGLVNFPVMTVTINQTLKNIHIASARYGIFTGTFNMGFRLENVGHVGGWGSLYTGAAINGIARCLTSNSNWSNGIDFYGHPTNSMTSNFRMAFVDAKQNQYGIASQGPGRDVSIYRLRTEGNSSGGAYAAYDMSFRLMKSLLQDTVPTNVQTLLSPRQGIFSQDDGEVSGTHKIYTGNGTIQTATDRRHTATDVAWKFIPTVGAYAYIGPDNPIEVPVGRIKVAAGSLVTASIWANRNITRVKGRLMLKGGQIQITSGSPDVYADANPTVDTWTQYSISFTPAETGVVEFVFQFWTSVLASVTDAYWIDDFSVSQA